MVDHRKVYKLDVGKAEQTKQRLQEESQASLLPMFKIPEGETVVRILPPWSELGDIGYECRSHWRIPPDDKMYPCLKQINQECPLCEFYKELRNTGKDEFAKRIYANKSIYLNAIIRKEEAKGIQIIRCGTLLYQELIGYAYDPDYLMVDLEKGRDMTIERVGQGQKDTRYTVKPAANASPLHKSKKIAQKWIDEMFDLDSIMQFPTREQLEGVVSNISGGRVLDADVEEQKQIETSDTGVITEVSLDDDEIDTKKIEEDKKKKETIKKLQEELSDLVGDNTK